MSRRKNERMMKIWFSNTCSITSEFPLQSFSSIIPDPESNLPFNLLANLLNQLLLNFYILIFLLPNAFNLNFLLRNMRDFFELFYIYGLLAFIIINLLIDKNGNVGRWWNYGKVLLRVPTLLQPGSHQTGGHIPGVGVLSTLFLDSFITYGTDPLLRCCIIYTRQVHYISVSSNTFYPKNITNTFNRKISIVI